ncbi:hypothetical protein [Flavobacterium sp. UBA6046]|jgi:hypothetical protein|uniref:hypothetical protein n=1 Tax=Flavobacterium sp. UBA6046 TaxID=1946552 RepID=UPI0025C53B29|nr:hypothetical protein [Flavobacterium sp. UBA6046]
MTIEQIQNRLAFLHLCLQFSSQEREKLTVYDRMLINQERGKLLNAIDFSQTILRPVPNAVEAKLTEIKILIKKHNWQPFNSNELNGK